MHIKTFSTIWIMSITDHRHYPNHSIDRMLLRCSFLIVEKVLIGTLDKDIKGGSPVIAAECLMKNYGIVNSYLTEVLLCSLSFYTKNNQNGWIFKSSSSIIFTDWLIAYTVKKVTFKLKYSCYQVHLVWCVLFTSFSTITAKNSAKRCWVDTSFIGQYK